MFFGKLKCDLYVPECNQWFALSVFPFMVYVSWQFWTWLDIAKLLFLTMEIIYNTKLFTSLFSVIFLAFWCC